MLCYCRGKLEAVCEKRFPAPNSKYRLQVFTHIYKKKPPWWDSLKKPKKNNLTQVYQKKRPD